MFTNIELVSYVIERWVLTNDNSGIVATVGTWGGVVVASFVSSPLWVSKSKSKTSAGSPVFVWTAAIFDDGAPSTLDWNDLSGQADVTAGHLGDV